MKREKKICQICHRDSHQVDIVPSGVVRPAIAEIIKARFPDWSKKGYICQDDLKKFRYDYLRQVLEAEKGELSNLEIEVIKKLNQFESVVEDVDHEYDTKLTFGQRLSDRIAQFGGSWKFIIIFAITIFFWMAINSVLLLKKPFDPFPFILLNLVLSCLAALQAPIIMMSQNRQEDKDRFRAENDYVINLKAELEIQQLHQKIDHLLNQQWERMVDIQEIQMEMMEDIRDLKITKKPGASG